MPRRSTKQLDLFYAFVGDVPLWDEREGMSLPLASLGKRKRTKPSPKFTPRSAIALSRSLEHVLHSSAFPLTAACS